MNFRVPNLETTPSKIVGCFSLMIVGYSNALVVGCLFWSGTVEDCTTKPRAFATKPMRILVSTPCHIWLEVQLHEHVNQVGGKT